MVKSDKLSLKANKSSIIAITEFLIIIAIYCVSFLVFFYNDYADSLDNGIMLGECIMKGNVGDYYHYCVENASELSRYTANYNIILYFVFLIWNFPTFILHINKDLDYMMSVEALLWAKSLILIAVLYSAFLIKKITKLFADDKKIQLTAVLLYLANTCVLFPTMMSCQYDIFAIVPMLLGLYYYIKGDNKKFVIWFMVAMPMKSFALFIFVPLLILKEKNVIKIALYTVLINVPAALVALPFRNDMYYRMCIDSQNDDAMSLILKSAIAFKSDNNINLIVACFLVLLVFCYMFKKEDERFKEMAVFVSFAAISSLLLFMKLRSYWIILIIPFAVLSVFASAKNLRLKVLVLTFASFFGAIYKFVFHSVYREDLFTRKLILSKYELPAFEELKYAHTYGLFKWFDLTKYSVVFRSVFIIGFVILLVLCFPRKKNISEEYKTDWWMLPLQIAFSAAFLAVTIYPTFVAIGPAIYSLEPNSELVEKDLLNCSYVSQSFVAQQDDVADVLYLDIYRPQMPRITRDTFNVKIVDRTTGEVVYSGSYGTAILQKRDNHIDLPSVSIIKDHMYTVTFSEEVGREEYSFPITLYRTNKLQKGYFPAVIDGNECDYSVIFTIK